MVISKREKKLLVAVLVAAVFAGFYLMFYQPTITRVEQVFVLVENEQAQLQDLLIKERERKIMLEEITQIETDIAAAIGSLPEAGDEPGLVKHLYHMFAPFNGKNTLHIDDPIVHPEFSEVRVNLSLETSYTDFNSLLKALEDSTYKNRLDNFSVSETQTGNVGEAGMVSVDMALTFYFSN